MALEQLTSVHIRGRWHARYPSALRTLCLLEAPTGYERELPDCRTCSVVARRFHAIDGSMPPHWLPEEELVA